MCEVALPISLHDVLSYDVKSMSEDETIIRQQERP